MCGSGSALSGACRTACRRAPGPCATRCAAAGRPVRPAAGPVRRGRRGRRTTRRAVRRGRSPGWSRRSRRPGTALRAAPWWAYAPVRRSAAPRSGRSARPPAATAAPWRAKVGRAG
ncbi:hypothetical protein DR950_04325 [Kitasatospora xanthocidica]|uniref:Uncharacterized protein n=1 Tax=Kitasatospora xanthocidica TaxID=83382 RepID=A0A372ZNJ2_9ACTN|nr:hypothetical protein DR950_04325 [Kitasatospora xanthocidica]